MRFVKYEELEGGHGTLIRLEYETAEILDKKSMLSFAQELIDSHLQRNGGLERVSILERGQELGREILEDVRDAWYQLAEVGAFQQDIARLIVAGFSHRLSMAFQMVLFADTKKILILSPEAYYFEKHGQNALDGVLAELEQVVEQEKSGMRKVTHADYQRAATFWKRKDLLAKEEGRKIAAREVVLAKIENLIQQKKVAFLASGAENAVRCTPVEYLYFDGAFWIFSRGGQKFLYLEKNEQVSLAIVQEAEDVMEIKSLQITGEARVVDYFSREYLEAVKVKGLSEAWLRGLAEPMNLIQVVPKLYEYRDEALAKEDLDIRQSLVME